jgi:tRNA threonylcarbamoyladenosine biosynthesis protein TsaE
MKDDFEIIISSTDELNTAAEQLLNCSEGAKVFCFNAPMGAGKTTFIKQLCLQLNYNGIVSSPTFPIINDYGIIYHIDCYRLKSVDEAIQVGMEDCIYSGKHCFIEWADMVKEILPDHYINVSIEIIGENSRQIRATLISK